jgi:CBS domain-containing protein
MIVPKVVSVMTPDVVTVTEQAPFVDIVRMMARYRRRPAGDAAGPLLGPVSSGRRGGR